MQAEVNLDNVTKQGWAILREVVHEYFERDGIPKELMPADLVDRNIIPKGRKGDIPKGRKGDIPKGGRGDIPKGGRGDIPKGGRRDIPKGGRGDITKRGMGDIRKGGMGGIPKGGRGDIPKGGRDGILKGEGNIPKEEWDIIPKGGRGDIPKGGRDDLSKGGRDDILKGEGDNIPKVEWDIIPKGGRGDIPKGGRGDIPKGVRGDIPKGGRGDIPKRGMGDTLKGVTDFIPKEETGVFPKEFTPAELVDREPVLNIASRSVWHRDGERSEDVPRMSKSKSAPSRSHDEEHQKVEVVYTDAELVHMIALHLASVGDKLSAEGTPNPCPSLTSKDAINQMFIQVFKDGVYSWEHVGLLFRRTAKACEKALNQTDEILDKVMKLFRASVAPWIVESGGWVSPPLDSVSTDGGEPHSEVSGIPATEGQRPQTVVHGRAGTSPPHLGSRSRSYPLGRKRRRESSSLTRATGKFLRASLGTDIWDFPTANSQTSDVD